MGDSISKYFENVGHFGNNAKEIEKVMSDREIMNAKNGKSTPDLNSTPVEIFEHEYPELADEFIQIQKEMYEMFARKHMDYGLNNIALGGDILNNVHINGNCIIRIKLV